MTQTYTPTDTWTTRRPVEESEPWRIYDKGYQEIAELSFTGADEERVATLISQAPALLEALEALLDQADETYPHFEDTRGTANRERARLIIQRARGEE